MDPRDGRGTEGHSHPRVQDGKGQRAGTKQDEIPFEYIAQSFVAAPAASDMQVPLSFYRKGQIDIQQERFIDALYDFYFVFEHLYAAGKYRSHQVKEAFQLSPAMRNAVLVARREAKVAFDNPTQKLYYENKYVHAADDEVLNHIVELRGRVFIITPPSTRARAGTRVESVSTESTRRFGTRWRSRSVLT